MHKNLQADHSSSSLINNPIDAFLMAKPLIPWVGGKRRLAQFILPTFPEHTCYVEPFCGAAPMGSSALIISLGFTLFSSAN